MPLLRSFGFVGLMPHPCACEIGGLRSSPVAATRLTRSLRVTLLGLAVNTVLAGSKMAGGLLGHSHALLADGVESLADVFSSLVVWRGLVVAAGPPGAEHPFCHCQAEPLAAALVGSIPLPA